MDGWASGVRSEVPVLAHVTCLPDHTAAERHKRDQQMKGTVRCFFCCMDSMIIITSYYLSCAFYPPPLELQPTSPRTSDPLPLDHLPMPVPRMTDSPRSNSIPMYPCPVLCSRREPCGFSIRKPSDAADGDWPLEIQEVRVMLSVRNARSEPFVFFSSTFERLRLRRNLFAQSSGRRLQ